MNGVELKVPNDEKRIDNSDTSRRNDVSDSESVPTSTVDNKVDNKLRVATSVFKSKNPSKISASAVIWKPPSSPDLRSTSPDPSTADLKVSTPSECRRKPAAVLDTGSNPPKPSTGPISTKDASSEVTLPGCYLPGCYIPETPSVPYGDEANISPILASSRNKSGSDISDAAVITLADDFLDGVNVPVFPRKKITPGSESLISSQPGFSSSCEGVELPGLSESNTNSSVSLPVDLIDLHSSEDDCPVNSAVRRNEPKDTTATVFDKEIAEVGLHFISSAILQPCLPLSYHVAFFKK